MEYIYIYRKLVIDIMHPDILSIILISTRVKVEFEAGEESFHCVGQHVTAQGFTSIMPWLAVSERNIPQFSEGENIRISRIEIDEVLEEQNVLVYIIPFFPLIFSM